TPPYALQPRLYLGSHGYDPSLDEMNALFIAHGPSIAAGTLVRDIASVDVYGLMCQLLGIPPADNQGSTSPTARILNARAPRH
ncbi:MAG TPA: alkaline phosphatase family protein, partial [Aquimonas sp.]|nr:alkaline phosphatase family protein [Aquimonas sp.]